MSLYSVRKILNTGRPNLDIQLDRVHRDFLGRQKHLTYSLSGFIGLAGLANRKLLRWIGLNFLNLVVRNFPSLTTPRYV